MGNRKISSIQRPSFHRESAVVPSGKRDLQEHFRNDPRQNSLGTLQDASAEVFFSAKDRRAHTHIIGATGTGKSKFMELLMRQDIRNRKAGFCLLDPHGSLYEEMVQFASHRYPYMADRFVLFDPAAEAQQVVGFNPIPPDAHQNMDYILDMLISACLKAWGQDNTDKTPRITKWLENIFYTIIANDLTLVETAPLLSISKRYIPQREKLLRKVSNDVILDDWEMFKSSTNTQKQMLIEGASNRLRKFLRNEAIRNVIGQKSKTLDLAKIMDEGKILLINLNGRERISYENTKLLGIMLVNEFFRVAKLRNPHDRKLKPFYLYVDEFANFITRDIARALEECRKFQLFLILAHQHLAQLKEEDEYLFASVLTNCRNRVVFGGLSKYDAQIMTDELATGFVNLKKIKDEVFTTKVRHIEETRLVKSSTEGSSVANANSVSTGTSNSETSTTSESETKGTSFSSTKGGSQSKGVSFSEGSSTAEGSSTSQSRSTGRTETESWNQTKTKGSTHGFSDGVSESDGQNWSDSSGTSQAQNYSRSQGGNESMSRASTDASGWSEQNGSSFSSSVANGQNSGYASGNHGQRTFSGGNSLTRTTGEGTQRSQGRSGSHSDTHTTGLGRNWNETQGFSQTENESHSDGGMRSSARSHTDSFSQSESDSSSLGGSRATTTTETESETQSLTKTTSESKSESASQTKSWSSSEGHNESRSQGSSTAVSQGSSQSQTQGTTNTESESHSQSTVPFLRPEEYQELSSRNFWSKDELLYMELAALKNQKVGQAFIKIGGKTPVRTNIDFVASVPFNPRFSPLRIAQFQAEVVTKNQDSYTPLESVRREYELRQAEFFGEPLRFDEKPLLLEVEVVDEEKDVRKGGLFT